MTGALMEVGPIFAALADPTRLRLVVDLGEHGPRSLVKLAGTTSLSRQAVTKHLRVLESAGLLDSAQVGRERIWRLDAHRLGDAGSALALASRRWDAALDRLRSQVEEPPAPPGDRRPDGAAPGSG